ncbi:MAG: aminoglycoside 6'-N-acetyltransferase [Bryobacteraceae bacterium]|jgi:aminoglycoside 6'-N-acetyltransferase I
MNFSIEPVQPGTEAFRAYCSLRNQLWQMGEAVCEREALEILADSRWAVFVSRLDSGVVVGFLEVHLRDYAEGAESSPVGYLEGLYVAPEYRKQGIGGALIRAGDQWAWSRGCIEIASDAQIDNAISIEMHKRMGYTEVERQVCFLKRRE